MSDIKVGDILDSHRCGKFEIIEIGSIKHRVTVRFLDTGYTTNRNAYSVKQGVVGDPYCPKIAGVGWIGDGKYKSRTSPPESLKTPQYRCWENMLYRVYDTNHRLANRYSGRGVQVCEDWLDYQVFAEWFDENYVEDQVLDKDVTCPGSLEYSPETCSFIPQEINKFFGASNTTRGKYPVGVLAQGNTFVTRVVCRGQRVSKSGFNTPEEAFTFYKEHKENFLKEMAQEYYDDGRITKDVYINLMQWEAVPYPD